jgi:hypothetical protein
MLVWKFKPTGGVEEDPLNEIDLQEEDLKDVQNASKV